MQEDHLDAEGPFRYILNRPLIDSEKVSSDAGRGQEGYFCQNSLFLIDQKPQSILYVPAYLRCHFRNMTEMDIQNLSCSFIATMNITFYLGKYHQQSEESTVQCFAEKMHDILIDNLKITFQNDFVINMNEDVSNNVSDSDRLVRVELKRYTTKGVTRFYSNIIITRGFKFGLHSDIFFFPLEQNILDLVTTLHPIKTKVPLYAESKGKKGKGPEMPITIRFNCMNLQIGQTWQTNNEELDRLMPSYEKQHDELIEQLKQLYMLQKNGRQLTPEKLKQKFILNTNYPFFRDIKISFPLKQNATEFGYYHIIERDVKISYTRDKQLTSEETCYEKLKNCLFCKKKIVNYDQTEDEIDKVIKVGRAINLNGFDRVPTEEDRSREESFCNAIMSIPILKASLGTIIQLCIPIFFLSFLTLVEFLYSKSTTLDQVRGQKIGSSTLIVATYISFIYLMRTVIPPTPSWSLFEVAVCLLAASCLAPIIESIYQTNINNVDNPFLATNVLFIASFVLNASLSLMIVIMLISIWIYKARKTKRTKSINVSMADLLDSLTKKYFYLWRNSRCKVFLGQEMRHYGRKRGTKIRCDL